MVGNNKSHQASGCGEVWRELKLREKCGNSYLPATLVLGAYLKKKYLHVDVTNSVAQL